MFAIIYALVYDIGTVDICILDVLRLTQCELREQRSHTSKFDAVCAAHHNDGDCHSLTWQRPMIPINLAVAVFNTKGIYHKKLRPGITVLGNRYWAYYKKWRREVGTYDTTSFWSPRTILNNGFGTYTPHKQYVTYNKDIYIGSVVIYRRGEAHKICRKAHGFVIEFAA